MKILIVSSWYPPIVSGSSLWAESLVKALTNRGHNVRVLTCRWRNEAGERKKSKCNKVYYIPARRLPRNRFVLGLSIVPISFSIANFRRVVDIVRAYKPDIIHQISHIFDSVLLTAYAAKKTKTPIVGSITTPIQSNSKWVHNLMRMVDSAILYQFGIRCWDRIICSDSTHVRYVLDTYGNNIERRIVSDIYPGVHERVGLGKKVKRSTIPQIVTVGHVHTNRDPTNIIKAMPAILKRFPDARLDIVGRIQFDQPVNIAKQLGMGEHVRFLGEVAPERVSTLISRAQLFVILHQMRYSGFSFTCFEAMQFGTPVIINAPEDLYGPGVIKNGENVVLVNREDVGEIARKIIHLLENGRQREQIGQNAKKFVTSKLNWDVCAEKTESLYRQILSEKN